MYLLVAAAYTMVELYRNIFILGDQGFEMVLPLNSFFLPCVTSCIYGCTNSLHTDDVLQVLKEGDIRTLVPFSQGKGRSLES